MNYEGFNKPWIAWVYNDGGWHPNEYDTLKEAIAHQTYGAEKQITRGVVDWEATPKD